jgi:hypothetical protein
VSEHDAGFPFRTLAVDEGLVFPDHFVAARRWGSRDRVAVELDQLAPGVTEIHLQPAVDTPEVRALAPEHWTAWVDDLAVVERGGPLDIALARAGVVRIGFRALRSLMRAG